MGKTKLFVCYVLACCFLVIFPLRDVIGGDVQFYFSQTGANDHTCFVVIGPFGRTSGQHRFDGGNVTNDQFYTAGDGIGSQYGKWKIFFRIESSSSDADLRCTIAAAALVPEIGYDHEQDFDVNSTSTKVFIGNFPGPALQITQEGAASARPPGEGQGLDIPTAALAAAALGDDFKIAKPDRDTFSFDATEGDEITLRLEENLSTGHLGSQATLRLEGGPLRKGDEVVTGDVPFEMSVTIPATGRYEIMVEQTKEKGISPEEMFRGNYFLLLKSFLGDFELIPGNDVEF